MADAAARAPAEITARDGRRVLLRAPKAGDAPALLAFINAVSRERIYLSYQGEQLSLADEEMWLRGRLAGIAAGREVFFLLEDGRRVVGTASIQARGLAERHVADLGISLASGYRGVGLGSALLGAIVDEARRRIAGLQIITLAVFAGNEPAIRLYERHGFVRYGLLPGGFRHRGQMVDALLMYRVVGAGQASGEAGCQPGQ